MCVLNKKEIERYCKEKKLLDPYDTKKIKYASYDLSVGEEYRLTYEKEVRKIHKNGSAEIPPYEICFILTEETINLPNDICAFLFSRHRAAKEGFLMHPQPPIDPGYKGKLYILLHNISNQTVHLQRGEHLASIVFLKSSPLNDDEIYGSNKDEDKYMKAQSLYEFLNNKTYTPAIRESVEKVKKTVENWKESFLSRWMPWILVIITIILMILTILFGILIGVRAN